MSLNSDRTEFKDETLAQWPSLKRSLEDKDVLVLWQNQFRTVDSLQGASRNELEDIDFDKALLIIKPHTGMMTSDQALTACFLLEPLPIVLKSLKSIETSECRNMSSAFASRFPADVALDSPSSR